MIVTNEISKQILENALKNNKISHAYLFEFDSSLENNELVFSFVKKIVCPYKKTKDCSNCNICNRIDNGNYPDLKIIEPDGLWIKKEQLINLQNQFNKKSIESEYMVYIIKEADKMNLSSANTILKFLEEPEEGIVAILTTSNIKNVLPTIISRCQIVSFKTPKKINNDYNNDELQIVIEFLNILEKNKKNTIAYIDNDWNNIVKNREEIIKCFDIMLLIYTDILNYILFNSWEIFENIENLLGNIIKLNSKDTIYKKINIIIDIKEKLKYNTNTNLLMDKFIIEFSGVD